MTTRHVILQSILTHFCDLSVPKAQETSFHTKLVFDVFLTSSNKYTHRHTFFAMTPLKVEEIVKVEHGSSHSHSTSAICGLLKLIVSLSPDLLLGSLGAHVPSFPASCDQLKRKDALQP